MNKEFVLEINIDRVSELMCIGGSFEVPMQIVSEVEDSGKVLFNGRYGTIIICVKISGTD